MSLLPKVNLSEIGWLPLMKKENVTGFMPINQKANSIIFELGSAMATF
jgi:hypothetical protein